MARTRNIKIGFFENELLAECDPLARLLFAGMWCIADRHGHLEYRPRRLKKQLLPWDDCDIDHLLQHLSKRDFIDFYTSQSGLTCIQIKSWKKHQRPHKDEAAYELTPVPGSFRRAPGEKPLIDGCGLRVEGSGLRVEMNSSEPPSAASEQNATEQPLLVFDCVGRGETKTWALTQSKLDEWQASYPSLDVLAEIRRARQWIVDRPTRKKTVRGMPAFIGSWLDRATNRGGNNGFFGGNQGHNRNAPGPGQKYDPNATPSGVF